MVSASSPGTIYTTVRMPNRGDGKVICMWEQMIELSKARVMPGITPQMQMSWKEDV